MIHKADYCLILCIDYRIQETFYDWIKQRHLLGKSDIIEIAGSSRDIVKPIKPEDKEEILRNIDISVKLHNPKNIFIFDHQDCGAYDADKTIPTGQPVDKDKTDHKQFIRKAKALLNNIYPEINIQTYYITLNHNVQEI